MVDSGSASARLSDAFWAPRIQQLRTVTLEVIRDRLVEQGVVDNFRRLLGEVDAPRRAMHFSDSDLYKWLEAAALAGRIDLCEGPIDWIERVQAADGYLHTCYGTEGGPARYGDLDFGHEHYCFGHLIEAAVSHHQATGGDRLLGVAVRLADHLCESFGPGRDERTDAHPEIELALCRLAAATGTARYVDHAAWTIETRLRAAGVTLDGFRLGGHAVRSLYLASGIAEVATATGEPRWIDAARRAFGSMIEAHAYPTGAVGGRWLGEAVGKPYEQPDAMAYAESCAAVAAAQLSWRIWRLTRDPRALDQLELLLFNAVPCGVGEHGDTWFYSQPQAVSEVAAELNPWVQAFDYGQLMLRQWFPARRHRWFEVPCCPPNLARLFAAVERHVAEIDGRDLLIHLPLRGRISGGGWEVAVESHYPDDGRIAVAVHEAPEGGRVRVRRPGFAGGSGHVPLAADGRIAFPVDWEWWTTHHRVEGAGGTVHLRRGPVVYCLEGTDHPEVDLRDLVVDPTRAPADAFSIRTRPALGLHHPHRAPPQAPTAIDARPLRYADWANRGASTMRIRFPTP